MTTKLTFHNIDDFDKVRLFQELGMVDFEYGQLHSYLEQIELYRAAIIQKLTYYGNNQSVDSTSGHEFDSRVQTANSVLGNKTQR